MALTGRPPDTDKTTINGCTNGVDCACTDGEDHACKVKRKMKSSNGTPTCDRARTLDNTQTCDRTQTCGSTL